MHPFQRQPFVALSATVLVCIAIAFAPRPAHAQRTTPTGLLRDLPSVAMQADAGRHAIRARSVSVDLAQVRVAARVRSSADVAPTVLLNLFPDATFTAVLDRIDTPASGFVWVGHVAGEPESSVTLSVEGDVMSGGIVTPQGAFTIRYAGNGHLVSQIDQATYPSELPPLTPVNGTAGRVADAAPATVGPVTPQNDDGSTIDVMVLYTPAVAVSQGGDTAARTWVNLGISETNTSYANSGITQRVRLVYTGQVAYTESPSGMGTDLTNVSDVTNPAVGQSVAALRDTYGADLVSLWVHYSAPSACGIAYVMTTIDPSFAPYAYSVVDDECVSPNYSFAHEMGHNMGAQHDWFVDQETVPRTYAHGYVYVPGQWRTIMAYPYQCTALGISSGCTRLPYWSSPTHTYNGAAMGVAAGTSTACVTGNTANPPCDADDAQLLNETALTVANFRQAVPTALTVTGLTSSPVSPAPVNTAISWTASVAGGTGPFTYEFFLWNGVSWSVAQDWSPSNSWSWTPAVPGTYSVQVWVRNAGSAAVYDAWLNSGTYTVTVPSPLTVSALIATPASTAVTNTPVVWTAFVSGGTGPYSYKFLLWNGSTWSVGQDWSASPSWTWMPAVPGTYSVQAWVRNAGSIVDYDAWRGSGPFTVTAPPPLRVTSLTSDRTFPVPAGTPVTWIASATGGSAPYTFKFLLYNGTSWSVGRDWSTANSWVWVPAVGGVYVVQVWARNGGSTAAYDSWLGSLPLTISGTTPLTVTSLTIGANVGSAAIGSTVPVVASAVGGLGPYTYKFLVYNGATWSIAQDWSSSNVWNWTPSAAGTYSVQVWVRNSGSVTAWDAWRGGGPIGVSSTLLGTQGFGGGELAIVSDQTIAQPFTLTSAINLSAVDLVMSGFGVDQFTVWITDSIGPATSLQNVRFKQNGVFPSTGGGLTGTRVTMAANVHLDPGTYYVVVASPQQDISQGWLIALSALPSGAGSVNTPILATCCAVGGSNNAAFPPASQFVAANYQWMMSFGLR